MNRPEKFHIKHKQFTLREQEITRFKSKDNLFLFYNKLMSDNASNIKFVVTKSTDPGDPEGGYYFLWINWDEMVENKYYDEEMKRYSEFIEKEFEEIRKK